MWDGGDDFWVLDTHTHTHTHRDINHVTDEVWAYAHANPRVHACTQAIPPRWYQGSHLGLDPWPTNQLGAHCVIITRDLRHCFSFTSRHYGSRHGGRRSQLRPLNVTGAFKSGSVPARLRGVPLPEQYGQIPKAYQDKIISLLNKHFYVNGVPKA